MSTKIVIIGKPNVGKSSLFNMILKKNIAIVDNMPGLTRDLRKKKIKLWEKNFEITDSPGLVNGLNCLEKKIKMRTIEYAKSVDLIILVFDGRTELSIEDYEIIKISRKLNKKILPVLNKTEGNINDNLKDSIKSLGLGNALNVSASHNQNIDQLKWKIHESIHYVDSEVSINKKIEELSVAIVGKTNSGKSTIFNLINKNNLSLTGSEPNLTRDTVESHTNFKDLDFKIFDTAGFSKKNNEKINKLSIHQTLKKIRLCKLIIIVFDINNYFEKINSKIVNLVYSENRCFIVLVNKIDSFKDAQKNKITKHIVDLNPQLNGAPIKFVSAKENIGFDDLNKVINSQLLSWNKRIKTSELNHWLKNVMRENPPPLKNGNIVKLKFISQVDISPPKFNVFSNFPESLNSPYRRYISNKLKKNFDLIGLPVKVLFKKTNNPYEKN